MNKASRTRLVWLMLASWALPLAAAAVAIAIRFGDVVTPLLGHESTIGIGGAVLLWAGVAWAARRYSAGEPPKVGLKLRTAFLWGGSRVALLVAAFLVMAGWLVSQALGLPVATAFGRALVLLLMVAAFSGIAGGAFFNSLLAARHWRARRAERVRGNR